jgi:hypothetical protein
MAEVSYYPEIECEVFPSQLLDTEIIGVPDVSGKRQFLRVAKGFTVRDNNKQYLPVGIVRLDYDNKRALIELSREADSGANRLWVPFSSFRQEKEEGP